MRREERMGGKQKNEGDERRGKEKKEETGGVEELG